MQSDSHKTVLITMLNLELPERFPLSIVMERIKVLHGKWEDERWQASGILVGGHISSGHGPDHVIYQDALSTQTLCSGFELKLHKDEGESYYYNLLSDHPSLFVVCRRDETDNHLFPVLVTASYDEAAAYFESEDEVFTVPMPAEVYRWVEAYVLQNYAPEPRRKRKRQEWHEGGGAHES